MKKTFLINITAFTLLSISLTGCKKEYRATYIFTETPQIVSDYQGSVNTEEKNCGGKWWLRSPYYDGKSYARDVLESGFTRKSNHSDSELEGIVPAITIKRENLK